MAFRTAAQKRAAEDAKADEAIRTAVRVVLAVRQLSMDSLAAALGMSRATLYARMKKPTDFTMGEIRTLRRLGGEHIDI